MGEQRGNFLWACAIDDIGNRRRQIGIPDDRAIEGDDAMSPGDPGQGRDLIQQRPRVEAPTPEDAKRGNSTRKITKRRSQHHNKGSAAPDDAERDGVEKRADALEG